MPVIAASLVDALAGVGPRHDEALRHRDLENRSVRLRPRGLVALHVAGGDAARIRPMQEA
jgi:hypothetical protein